MHLENEGYQVRAGKGKSPKLNCNVYIKLWKQCTLILVSLNTDTFLIATLTIPLADTRATHLERSRTKGVIKGLTMTIYYQREFWIKHGAPERPKTLAQYFRKK